MTIKQIPSPNHSGPRSRPLIAIVLHIMDGSLEGTDAWFQNPASQASAHYGIGKDGEIHQYVQDSNVAWHAGRVDKPTVPVIPGVRPNYYTLGIEHEGWAYENLPLEMYVASARLLRKLSKTYGLPLDPEHVWFHREVYSKKTCPGTLDRGLLLQLASHVEPE